MFHVKAAPAAMRRGRLAPFLRPAYTRLQHLLVMCNAMFNACMTIRPFPVTERRLLAP